LIVLVLVPVPCVGNNRHKRNALATVVELPGRRLAVILSTADFLFTTIAK
jgi:hypothetical protein